MLSHAHRRKTNVAWVALLAVTVVLTTGFAIPINVGSLTEWQPRSAHTVGAKRCNQPTDAPGRSTRAAGAQANNEKNRNVLARLFL